MFLLRVVPRDRELLVLRRRMLRLEGGEKKTLGVELIGV